MNHLKSLLHFKKTVVKLEIRAKQFLLGSKGIGGKGGSWRKRGVMTQSLYAHMNK
jgi:hypothetical protein